MPARRLVVKLTAGLDDPERATMALSVAAAAVAGGFQVSLWLSGEAVSLALPGGADGLALEHSPPASASLAAILEGGTVTACAPCLTRRGLSADDLVDGVGGAGAASFVADATADDTTALVY